MSLKKSSRRLQDMSWRRLQAVFEISICLLSYKHYRWATEEWQYGFQRGFFQVDVEVADGKLERFSDLYPRFVVEETINGKLPEHMKIRKQTIGRHSITRNKCNKNKCKGKTAAFL